MIYVSRPPAPAFLTDPHGIWVKETLDAIEHYEVKKLTTGFTFKKYRDPRVKEELRKIFKKCAYCEFNYDAGYDGDVEHFRPKGSISEKKPQTPGYYWLANDWNNLLLSCQHCNQSRKHKLYGVALVKTFGKLDQFPLKPGAKHISKRTAAQFRKEELNRLLINPCKEDPKEHFQYDKLEGVIIPITDKGIASARVYVLQRVNLVKERKKTLLLLFLQMGRVKRELDRYNTEQTAAQKKIFDEELDALLVYTKPEASYAGMSRYFVGDFLKANHIKP